MAGCIRDFDYAQPPGALFRLRQLYKLRRRDITSCPERSRSALRFSLE